MKQKKQVMATVLLCCFVITMSLSLLFVTTHLDHHHSGDEIDCEICDQIALCQGIIKQWFALGMVCMSGMFVCLASNKMGQLWRRVSVPLTLVRLKMKFSN